MTRKPLKRHVTDARRQMLREVTTDLQKTIDEAEAIRKAADGVDTIIRLAEAYGKLLAVGKHAAIVINLYLKDTP